MAKQPINWWLWAKMAIAGGGVIVGGPALVRWVQPTDEELFQKYNPELQKRSLENRYEREKDFDDFVVKLKEQAKSSKPIWIVQAEEAEKNQQETARQKKLAEALKLADEVKARKEALRREAGLPVEGSKSQ
ncbi:hypothetical protein QBC35DRAFT_483987 [Podospora australis]|uniref:Cytochrome b mRNA-processing protein 4 n=1 Tax=Podospora australis TaxID=1536484 RepID=A0AAN6X275_9PEZI|nr:hypothetical protein QBC35DRAFT_483987 [Podospora australis]